MDITVSARHIPISSSLRAAAEAKLARLSRFTDGMQRAEVHLCEEQNPRIPEKEICEISLDGGRHRLRAKAVAADPFAAIDLAVAKIEHQLQKLKTKAVLRSQQGPRRAAMAAGAEDLDLFPEDDLTG